MCIRYFFVVVLQRLENTIINVYLIIAYRIRGLRCIQLECKELLQWYIRSFIYIYYWIIFHTITVQIKFQTESATSDD